MRKTIILTAVTLLLSFHFTQAQNWLWVKDLPQSVTITDVISDSNGDSYLTGDFSGVVNFGGASLASDNGSQDVFVAKYAANGSLIWVVKEGGTGNEYSESITLDNQGNVIVVSRNLGLFKYNSSNGTLIWNQTFSYNSFSVVTDATNNIYVAINTSGTSSFTYCGTTFPSSNAGLLLVRLDANGFCLWAKKYSNLTPRDITIDASANIYVTGYYQTQTVLNNDTLPSSSVPRMFIAKFNPSGNPVWARWGGNSGSNNYTYGYSLSLGETNTLYISGYFGGTVNFGANTLVSSGNNDAFIAKYDLNGNIQWSNKAGGSSEDESYAVYADNIGNVYLSGFITGNALFGSFSTTNTSRQIFIATYNSSGAFQSIKLAGGNQSSNQEIRGMSKDSQGNLYIAGRVSSSGTGQTSNFDNISVALGVKAFIGKIGIGGGSTQTPIWNGTGNWSSNLSNWNINAVPQATDSVIVQSGTATVTSDQSVSALVLENGASIIVDGNNVTLTVNGNYYDKGGSINALNGATIVFNGNAYNSNNKRITSSSTFKVKGGIKVP